MATQVNALPVLEFCHVCTSFTSGDTEKGTSAEKVWAFSFSCFILFFFLFPCIISFAFSFFGVPGIGSGDWQTTQRSRNQVMPSLPVLGARILTLFRLLVAKRQQMGNLHFPDISPLSSVARDE